MNMTTTDPQESYTYLLAIISKFSRTSYKFDSYLQLMALTLVRPPMIDDYVAWLQ